jgi:hypothetical protein
VLNQQEQGQLKRRAPEMDERYNPRFAQISRNLLKTLDRGFANFTAPLSYPIDLPRTTKMSEPWVTMFQVPVVLWHPCSSNMSPV